MPVKVVEAQDVSVSYHGIEALSRVSFDVQSGDYVGIVGPNGSGKTTLVKALLGLVPFSGRIRFAGQSLSAFAATKHIGYLPQKMSFLDQRFPATAGEIVVSGVYCCKRFPIRLSRIDYEAAAEAMELLGVADLSGRLIGRLSGGQQQRILLARALVHHPHLLILDEPTVALDPQSREAFYATVEKLNKEMGVTVLLVSHDVGSVRKYATKLLYLDREVIFYGSCGEFCKSTNMTDFFAAGRRMV